MDHPRPNGAEPSSGGGAVRRAVPADAELLARLHVDTWRGAYRGVLPETVLADLSVERREVLWRRWLPEPSIGVFVAEHGGRGVGFASGAAARESDHDAAAAGGPLGELQTIYLLPEAWGLGLGRALWRAVVAWLAGRGCVEGVLWVLESNDRARGFYERMGWRPDGWTKSERMGEAILDQVRYRGPLQ